MLKEECESNAGQYKAYAVHHFEGVEMKTGFNLMLEFVQNISPFTIQRSACVAPSCFPGPGINEHAIDQQDAGKEATARHACSYEAALVYRN
jgi:hypothetical protein